MVTDFKGLQWVTTELFELAEKPNWSKSDKARNSNLIALRSALNGGAKLRDLRQSEVNDYERENGMRVTDFSQADEKHAEARGWKHFIMTGEIETRDQTVGDNAGTGPQFFSGNAGSFVPRSFMQGVKAAMKWYDPMFDPDVITYVETPTGSPLQAAFMSDVQAVAQSVTAENSDQSSNELDIASVGEVDINAYSYRVPIWRLSIEALQDLERLTTALDLFKVFSADRVARGVGKDLLIGNGVGKPLGLVTSLQLLSNAQGAVASGDSESTGGAQTGANSIGSTDLENLYASVDPAYRVQPKCAWLMNDGTRQAISSIIDKYGNRLNLIERVDGKDFLFGKPLYVSPSMPSISAASISVLFGDLSFWCTRHAVSGDRVQVIREAPGLAERGEVGLRTWSRYDGALLFGSSNSSATPPIKYLQQHT